MTFINIFVSNGVPYVWDPNAWKTLRVEHRIIGQFDGAVSVTGQGTRSLPLRLSDVQTQYLLQSGIARAVQAPKLCHQKGLVTKEQFLKRRNAHKLDQISQYKKTKRLELEAMVDKIIEGKRRKGRSLIPDRNTVIQEELAKINSLPYEMIRVDVEDPWCHNEEDLQPYKFHDPVSERDRLRLEVFKDFCGKREYYLTGGTAFGGDFLAYPGDPLEYHSEFIIICQISTQKVSDLSLVSHQRLAQTVKKTLLIASYDEHGQLQYEKITNLWSPLVRESL